MTAGSSGTPRQAGSGAGAKKASGSRGARIFGIVFGVLVFLGGAFLMGAHINTTAHSSAAVTAHVVGYSKAERCEQNDDCVDVFHPKVTFAAGSHGSVTATVPNIEPINPLANGTAVQVKYNLASPTQVRSASVNWWTEWGLPTLIMLIGLLIAWVFIPTRSRARKPQPRPW